MKIGIIGSGNVAQTLGKAWMNAGHDVLVGARNVKSYEQLKFGTQQEAASFGDVVLVAINPWTEIEAVVTSLTQELKGKTIIDVSNNIDFSTGVAALAFTDRSMGEAVQSWLPDSHVVKTLNITPAAMMVQPSESGIIPAIGWLSGNGRGAKQQVAALLTDLGWTEVVDLGDIHQSTLQESIGLTLSIIVMGVMAQK